MDVARGGRDDMEVVEEPLGSWRHRFLPSVLRQRRVRAAQGSHVPVELSKVGAAATVPAARGDREKRGKAPRMLFERFDAEQLLSASR